MLFCCGCDKNSVKVESFGLLEQILLCFLVFEEKRLDFWLDFELKVSQGCWKP